MSIQESGEMYLETILILSKKNPCVRSIDISEHMGFSKPSVSRAVSILKKSEYITVDKDGHIQLTKAGNEIAEKIYERHEVLAKTFIKLGIDEQTAYSDACKIEHNLSDETFDKIKEFYEKNIK